MQQQGGSQYGVPPPAITPFPPQFPQSARPRHNFDELVTAAAGSFPDDDEPEKGGSGSSVNRWPRQETLALLKIRSDMDAAFRDTALKTPLWGDVSRKLAELGFIRSPKKCKEKFENVHKYYRRTKESKASRPDGKSYRFFTQLEAIHTTPAITSIVTHSMAQPITAASPAPSPTTPIGVNTSLPSLTRALPPPPGPPAPTAAPATGISFSSDTFTTSSDSDGVSEGRKRKRGPEGSQKLMNFFEGLMKQVMDRQEAMQQRFMDAIEKKEQDRMVRDEAWKRQEMARLSREHEILAQERAMAAARDAAVIAFLQRVSGHPLQAPPVATIPAATAPPVATIPGATAPPVATIPAAATPPAPVPAPAPPAPVPAPAPPPQPVPPPPTDHLQLQIQPSSSSTEIVLVPDTGGAQAYEGAPSSSRWPKPEIHALINIRSGLEERYQEAGPKGPLWEEISAAMGRLGYSRSAKRCKEKWENINKYFKKVRESNKKRPEDAKTCPYYHQLELIYRKKSGSGGSGALALPATNSNSSIHDAPPMSIAIAPPQFRQLVTEIKNAGKGEGISISGGVHIQPQPNNGGTLPASLTMNKREEIIKEFNQALEQQQKAVDDYDKLEEHDSDNMDDEDDDDDDEEDIKMQYKIQYQKQNVTNGGDAGAAKPAATSSFLALVQ